MRYIVPQELRPQTKLWKSIYLSDLIFVVAYVIITNTFSVFVAEELSAFFFIFNVLVALSLTIKSNKNPGKKMYHTLLYLLMKDKMIYKPMEQKSKGKMLI